MFEKLKKSKKTEKIKKIKKIFPPPIRTNHFEYSMLFSLCDEEAFPTPSLIDLSLQAIKKAKEVDLSDLSKRLKIPPFYPNIWPGEHYKLLAGFILALNPSLVIEIGTATGLSSLAMKKYLSQDGKIFSFDLFSWKNDENTVFKNIDFEDKRLIQYVDDLSLKEVLEKYTSILQRADLIFIDVTHDGILEKKLLDNFESLTFETKPYFIFDDIRLWNMLKMWREIKHPKLDLTSFGHWSGTGIVALNNH